MKTLVFDSYKSFLEREDKSINGVSRSFALGNPDYEEYNSSNQGCWDCRGCTDCFYCSECDDCDNCVVCLLCVQCFKCYYCSECDDCTICTSCYNASYCEYQTDCYDNKSDFEVPVVKDLNKKVLEAVKAPNALDMGEWHCCATTHCRAGWIVHLAGEAGYKLEEQTDTAFAALLIYKASTGKRINHAEFFVSNEESMKLIEKAAC